MKTLTALAILMILSGCTTLPTQFHASERHCTYSRVGVEYELECKSKGVVELSDGPDLMDLGP